MGMRYLSISAVFTVLSFVGLQCGMELSLQNLRSDGFIRPQDADHELEMVWGSYATIALVANFVLNIFTLIILSLKTIFFVELYSSETRKLVELLIKNVIYKGGRRTIKVYVVLYYKAKIISAK